jgi:dihydrofolate reductase
MKKALKIALVTAFGKKFEIGKAGKLPGWNLPSDMKHFKELTEGCVVIMGRKTFESFPSKFRPLPKRTNIIITRNLDYKPEPTNQDTFIVSSLKAALDWAKEKGLEKVFIIGGGEIYKEALDLIEDLSYDVEIIATEIDGTFPDADVFFPKFDLWEWKCDVMGGYKKGPVDPSDPSNTKENSHDFTLVKYYM